MSSGAGSEPRQSGCRSHAVNHSWEYSVEVGEDVGAEDRVICSFQPSTEPVVSQQWDGPWGKTSRCALCSVSAQGAIERAETGKDREATKGDLHLS